MPVISCHETYEGAEAWFHQYESTFAIGWFGPQFQFPTIAGLPIGVEVEDDGDDAVSAFAMAIQMSFVKAAFWIDGKMAFEVEQAQEQLLIDRESERFKVGQIGLLSGRRFTVS